MCRHLAYLGPPVTLARLLTEPRHSLYEQSWKPARQRHATVNADGFGVGWYADEEPTADNEPGLAPPARYRRAVPIWADANFPDLARVIRSKAVLAAVRSATEGTPQDESASAPFREGRWLFSHNGAVTNWTRLATDLTPAQMLDLDAHSDSALLWATVTRRLRQGESPAGAMAAVVRSVAAVRPEARLNFLLTDGHTIAATAWGDTLWYRTDRCSTVVASEPDDTPGAWREVPDRSLLLTTRTGVRITPLVPATPQTTRAP
ncbi:ergothioneine biosynthesis protein EgtC [Streptomyces sp. NPDC054775]